MILTQSSERTFRLCQRLFRYRYIDHLAWPESVPGFEDLRARMERGSRFHLLVDRTFEGRPLAEVPEDITVPYERWRQLEFPMHAVKLPELELSYPYNREVHGKMRTDVLRARLDLLLLDLNQGRVAIYDWKLGTAPKDAASLQVDPQTVWYMYLAAALWPQLRTMFPAFAEIEDIRDRLSMTYWFAQPKRSAAATHTISYSQAQFLRDSETVENAVKEMVDRPYENYELTSDQNRCAACQYRTLCHRAPGPLQRIAQEEADLIAWDIDLDLEAEPETVD